MSSNRLGRDMKDIRMQILFFIKWKKTKPVSFGATRPQHLPKILLHSSIAALQVDLKRSLKSKVYSNWKDQETLKLKLLLLFSASREKLLRPSDCLTPLVLYIFVYTGVRKSEEEKHIWEVGKGALIQLVQSWRDSLWWADQKR